MLFAVPIKTKVAHDRAQPRREARPSRKVKLPQAAKVIGRKLLAYKQETVATAVWIAVKAADNVIDQAAIAIKKCTPSRLSLRGRERGQHRRDEWIRRHEWRQQPNGLGLTNDPVGRQRTRRSIPTQQKWVLSRIQIRALAQFRNERKSRLRVHIW